MGHLKNLALLTLVLATCCCTLFAQSATPAPTGVGQNGVVRLPVAHQHTGSWCLGYLYVTRDEVWYEVVKPPQYKSHAFRIQRSQIEVLREWILLGQPENATEIKFQKATYHFWLVRPQDVSEGPSVQLTAPGALPFQWLIAVIQTAGNLPPVDKTQLASNASVAPQANTATPPQSNTSQPNLPPRDPAQANDPKALMERAKAGMEAYRSYFRNTGDYQNIGRVQPYLSDARNAYQQFVARGDTANAARSLILAADLERMLVMQNVPEYQAKQQGITEDYQTALRLAKQVNDNALTIKALSGLLRTDLNSKDYAAGAQTANDLVKLAGASGTKEDLANAYDMRAELEREVGDLSAASDDLTRAVALKDDVKDAFLVWSIYSDRSDLYNDRAMKCNYQRDFDFCEKALQTAIQDCQQMVNVAQAAGFTYLQQFSQQRMGQLKLLQQKQQELAQTYGKLSVSSFYITKPSQVIMTPQFGRSKDPQMAATLRNYEKQLEGPENNYDPEKYEVEGGLQEMEGNNDEAMKNYLQAVSLLEKDRRKLGTARGTGQYLNDRISIYYGPAMQYLDRKEYAKAFDLLERSRSRAMAELMQSRDVTLNNPQDQALFAQSVELEAKLAAAQNKLFNFAGAQAHSDELNALQQRVDDLQSQYSALQNKISRQSPKLQTLGEQRPVTLETAQAAAKHGNYDMLYYLALEDGLLIWHIGGDSQHPVKVYYTRSTLSPRVSTFYKSLSDSHATFDEAVAKEFFLVLINTVLPYVTTKHLVIVAHEDLNSLPFQALQNPVDGSYLGERFQISYAPSATVLADLGSHPDFSHGRLLAVADPGINSAVGEVKTLGDLYPGNRGKVVTDPLARKQDVMNWVPDYNLVHLSMHGVFDSSDPLLSYLKMRPTANDDGHFTAAEMFGLRLPKNSMVVLSACETGRVEATHSNELLGMERSLLFAGASDLVLSSWEVDAGSTALWMGTFYREAQTKPPSEAARLALIAVKKVPEYQHPFFWAPFLLTGQ
jgi:CHAT domain-containing protein